MPTVHRFGSVSIRLYADDHHPPHFHIVAPEFQVLVRIDDFEIIAGSARAADLAEALIWAKANQPLLVQRWKELNEGV